ncbi:hypothetical protein CEV08_05870 [Bartonella tribocorum]|uniref:Uncharacterized protein n=1 Tax=Bartonella tribocorum TaxID=85701 RepID=A0A2M6UTT4_9HYPH|nr:hypothetical protein CEV08_05870 [Bartonella tribocorum]
MDAFESRKAELKNDGNWFLVLKLHILLKLCCLPISEITQTKIRNTLAPICHTKAGDPQAALIRLHLYLKHFTQVKISRI